MVKFMLTAKNGIEMLKIYFIDGGGLQNVKLYRG